MIRKIFDQEMLIRAKETTLLQIFCKIILSSNAIVKSSLDPDVTFWWNFNHINGLIRLVCCCVNRVHHASRKPQ